MHLSGFLLLATSWLPAPGNAGANQNVLARTIESSSSSSSPPPPPPPPLSSANSSSSSTSCPPLTPQPLTIAQLSSSFPARAGITSAWDLAAIDAIKHALTLYAFAIDGRDWDGLDHVFAPHATADYGPPINALAGRDQIKRTLPPYLTVFAATQHVLGTQVVSVCDGGEDDGERGDYGEKGEKRSAVSVTYFSAAHFKNGTEGKGLDEPVGMKDVMYAYGQYQDRWGVQEDGTWKIEHRNLVYMGPFVSDTSS